MTIGLAITGATGRMGSTLHQVANTRDDVEIRLSISQLEDDVNGLEVSEDSLVADLIDAEVDVLIDFTAPSSSIEYVTACAEAGIPAVVGTTGFEDNDWQSLRRSANTIPVLYAANFSRGIQVLSDIVGSVVTALDGYDIEVTETHHNAKRDAPSGTAVRLLSAIESVRDVSVRVHGRHGDTPRQSREIGVHARRAGSIPGEHEILVAGHHEVLTLTHRASDRSVFAVGAIDAAVWLVGHDAGWYEFSDVVGSDDQ